MKTPIRPLNSLEVETLRFRHRYVGVIVITQDLKILLQQRGDDWNRFPGYLATFGGRVEQNETSMEGLIRELKEELGAEVKPWEVVGLARVTEAITGHQDLIELFYWQDRHGTITGCYEGEARRFETVEAVLSHPKLMSEVRWLLEQFSTEQLTAKASDEIRIEPYSVEWPSLAKKEMTLLKQLCDWVVGIDHIGSTAVPDLPAKPVIDLAIGVTDLKSARALIPLLESHGYVFWADNPDQTKLFFAKGLPPFGRQRTHHVHVMPIDHHDWIVRPLFRDYLIRHPEAKQAYADLKQKLAQEYQADREAYTQAKTEFIRAINLKAIQEKLAELEGKGMNEPKLRDLLGTYLK
jgi:GrpB-like predicted nucleotidyltransferase (UPF0157 family)/ADP-ribose pyrophosphatase YjhB (NUDIX family)